MSPSGGMSERSGRIRNVLLKSQKEDGRVGHTNSTLGRAPSGSKLTSFGSGRGQRRGMAAFMDPSLKAAARIVPAVSDERGRPQFKGNYGAWRTAAGG